MVLGLGGGKSPQGCQPPWKCLLFGNLENLSIAASQPPTGHCCVQFVLLLFQLGALAAVVWLLLGRRLEQAQINLP